MAVTAGCHSRSDNGLSLTPEGGEVAYMIQGGSILEVSFEGTIAGQQFISLLHFQLDPGDVIDDGRAAALAALNIVNNAGNLLPLYAACISDEVLEIYTYAQWIANERYRYVIDPAGPIPGAVAQPAMPANVAVAITKFGEQADRHNLGTLHMPAVPTTFLDGSYVDAAVGMPAYTALADQLSESIVLPTGQELLPVMFNRGAPGDSAVIVGAFPQDTSRVMRRRTVGVGA